MKRVLFLIIILMISTVYAECNSTQIDIDSATAEELDQITGIGSVYAQRIIDDRPFNSVDELINVKGIGDKTLEKIKEQNLACVNINENYIEPNISEIDNSSNISINQPETYNSSNIPEEDTNQTIQSPGKTVASNSILNLSDTKNIKTENNVWSSDKIVIYGFVAFTIMLTILFIARRRKYKTEFEVNDEGRKTEDSRGIDP